MIARDIADRSVGPATPSPIAPDVENVKNCAAGKIAPTVGVMSWTTSYNRVGLQPEGDWLGIMLSEDAIGDGDFGQVTTDGKLPGGKRNRRTFEPDLPTRRGAAAGRRGFR